MSALFAVILGDAARIWSGPASYSISIQVGEVTQASYPLLDCHTGRLPSPHTAGRPAPLGLVCFHPNRRPLLILTPQIWRPAGSRGVVSVPLLITFRDVLSHTSCCLLWDGASAAIRKGRPPDPADNLWEILALPQIAWLSYWPFERRLQSIVIFLFKKLEYFIKVKRVFNLRN